MERNEKDFGRLVNTYKSTIYTVCYMFSKNEDEVNDLFQETLVNLWKSMETFRQDSKMETWIYRVALNTCITHDRKKLRQKIPIEMSVSLYQDNDADTRQIQTLHQRIGKLGLIDRAIVLLWLENMSYEEIGQIMGISAQNVGVKLFRIKELLKRG